jgi:hypothetical protein
MKILNRDNHTLTKNTKSENAKYNSFQKLIMYKE